MFRMLSCIACILPLFALAGCDKSATKGPVVTIGVSPFQDTILPKLGADKGWYEEEGLNVRFVILGWTEVNEALSASSGRGVDVAINNECGVIAAQSRNKQIVYYYGVNPFDNGFALMIRPNGGLHPISYFLGRGMARSQAVKATAVQLKGRTVITTSNTDMEQGVASAVERGGLDFRADIKIINLPPEEGLAAFLNGKGDAYIGGVPQRLAASRAGEVEMLTGSDLGPPPINGFVTTSEFLKNNPNIMPKVLKVWFRIVKYVDENNNEAAASVSKLLRDDAGVNLSPAEFAANWNHIESFPPSPLKASQDILSPDGKNYWRRRWDDCNNYFTKIVRKIPTPVNPEGVFLMDAAQSAVESAVDMKPH